jgi:hypothetical protein
MSGFAQNTYVKSARHFKERWRLGRYYFGSIYALETFMVSGAGKFGERSNQRTPRIHLKRDDSLRLALCGVFPRESFMLVKQMPELDGEELGSLCKICLAVAAVPISTTLDR